MNVMPGETIRDFMTRFLVEASLWPDDVETIMASVDNPALQRVWDQSCDGFPDTFIAIAASVARTAAILWIDTNQPSHIARYMLGAEVITPGAEGSVGTFGPGGADTPNMFAREGGGVGN